MTDDSAFKKQVRARMADTGEKYTAARRMILAEQHSGQPPLVLRVYLPPHVDLQLTADAGRAYAAADEQGRLELARRILAHHIEGAESANGHVAVGTKIVTDQDLRADGDAAEDAAIHGVVQRSIDRAIGVSTVTVDRDGDPVRVTIRAARPIVLVGHRGADADRLRAELEELTGKRVRLQIFEVPDSAPDLAH